MLRLLTMTSILLTTALTFRPHDALAEESGVRSGELVTLATAVAARATDVAFVRIGGSQNRPFVVPPGRSLVLTDFVCSPQAQPGDFSLQINASPEVFTTQLTFVASSAEPSSFQVHLQAGMSFVTGSKVLISMLSGDGPLNCYAYGRLEPAGRSHTPW